jgi:glycine dehydrogenase subunit 1
MSYLPLSDTDRTTMLGAIGVKDFKEIIAVIPQELADPSIDLPRALSEIELTRLMRSLAAKNESTDKLLSFVGAGAYDHFIPAVVSHVLGRTEFYSAYTPYQAEASQGTLQSIYEYQSMICRLTGMSVSNASHYDGATSMAEAALLSATTKKKSKILVAANVHPEYRAVLKTYLKATSLEIITVPITDTGTVDTKKINSLLDASVACCIVQTPNVFGLVESWTDVESAVHAYGAHFIMVANPLSLARFRPPGEWKADIACGEAQVLGNPLSFGGPYLGYFAVTQELMRKIPGRLVGMTEDKNAKRAYTLTLQTREQHIRREKATSNICSNQALCALAAAVYMSALGKEGIKRVADMNIAHADYLRKKIAALPGYSIKFDGPVFNEFVVHTKKPARSIIENLLDQNIHAGFDLEKWYPEEGPALLVCATETKTKDDLDRFIAALRDC